MFKLNDYYRIPKQGASEYDYPNLLSLLTAIQYRESLDWESDEYYQYIHQPIMHHQHKTAAFPLDFVSFHFRFSYRGKVTEAYITSLSSFLDDGVMEKLYSRLDNFFPCELDMVFSPADSRGLSSGKFIYSNEANYDLSRKHSKSIQQMLDKKIAKTELDFETQTPTIAMFWFVNFEGESKLQLVANNSRALAMLRPASFEEDLLKLSRDDRHITFLRDNYSEELWKASLEQIKQDLN